MDSPLAVSADAAPSPFAAVPAALQPALVRRGFSALTPVQTAVLDPANNGRDLQVSSTTGSGKTVALGLALAPALLALPTTRPSGPVALVVTPTRELAAQVAEELQWLFADRRDLTLDCVTGGTNVGEERHRLKRPPAVLVGTPGRLLDHLTTGALSFAALGQLVLDEADQMLDLGFRDELEAILAQAPTPRRTILVSATFPTGVRRLMQRYQTDPLPVQGTTPGQANADIEHIAHLLAARERYGALVNHLLLAADRRVLVFVRTREDTTGLADQLDGDGFRALPLSGDLTQSQRTRTLAAFKRGSIQVLVATDVAARGLDIPEVATVVHMDPPIDAAAYVHRSGRTGRAGQKGRSVVLVPKAREGALRRLLGDARVPVVWRQVPSAAAVRRVQRQQLLAPVRQRLEQPLDPELVELATTLAAERPAADWLAALLGELQARCGRAPEEFGNVGPRPVAAAARPAPARPAPVVPTAVATAAPPLDATPAAVAPAAATAAPAPVSLPPAAAAADTTADAGAADAPRPTRERRPAPSRRDGPPRFVRFRINWGFADGADPRRILAHVCRRGGIESHDVGGIDLDRYETTFEVVEPVVAAFTAAVRPRDRRDPHLVIQRVQAFRSERFRGVDYHPSHPQDRFARR